MQRSDKRLETYKAQAKKILRMAEKAGIEQNYFFTTTFERYTTQIDILTKLEEAIMDDGTLVTKEYVKGRENIYTHPAIREYNSTANAANRTVTTLIDIIAKLSPGKGITLTQPPISESDEL